MKYFRFTSIIVPSLLLGLLISFSFAGNTKAQEGSLELSGEDFSQTLTCPDTEAWHTHGYENTSGPEDGYEYYMAVTKFRIYLHDNFVENIDLDSLECALPSGYFPCEGTSSTDLGGSTIELVQGDSSSDAVYPDYVEWEFGITDASDKPIAPGYNDYDYDGTIDTTEDDRTVYTTLGFEFNEDRESGDSATTTSAIYVQFKRYDEAGCGRWSSSACWEDIEEGGETDKHWNTDTLTATTTYQCAGCASLSISPSSLSVSDVFSDTDFEVTATADDGTDITGDSQFTYSAFKYGTSTSQTPDADGDIRYGFLELGHGGNGPASSSYNDIEYEDSEPGDTLTVCVSDYEGTDYCGTGVCEVEVEFPYCTDLDITDPTGLQIGRGDSYENNIEIEVEASTGEDWPYDVTYESTDSDATFDGNLTPYTTDDWTIDSYVSDDISATMTAGLNDENGDGESDDVGGFCEDSFTHVLFIRPEVPTCDYLEIIIPSTTLTCEEMESGDVEITWVSFMTNGTAASGPWILTSSNSAGEFRLTPGGTLLGTGTALVPITTVFYTGEDGDTIQIVDPLYPDCSDFIDSETCEVTPPAPVCEDLILSDPYILNDDGSATTIDLSDNDDLGTLYDESIVCWDFSVTVSDSSYSGTLMAEGYEDVSQSAYNGNLSLTVNETGGSTTGNPASLGVTAYTNYTGTVCWENFEENNYLSLYMLGEEDVCGDSEELPPYEAPLPPEAPYCLDLQMSPDSYTMAYTDATAGTLTLTLAASSSDSTWTGALIVEKSGSGTLYYSDGSASEYSDGHLEIPISGSSATVAITYVNGVAGDTISAYVEDEVALCTDTLSISRESPPTTTTPTSPPTTPTSPPTGVGPSAKENECKSVTFEEDGAELEEITPIEGEDETVEICLDTEKVSQDLIINYVNPNGDLALMRYDSDQDGDLDDEDDEIKDKLTLEGVKDNECPEVLFKEIYEDAEISAQAQDETGQCTEELDVKVQKLPPEEEELELGSFKKSIFTFNFSTEKNPYTDEGVFFAHDEDRAFYTLEYDPVGTEETITFTDDLWTEKAGGIFGDGSNSTGTVSLATSYDKLTGGSAFDYPTLTNLGFGDEHEANSEDIADYIEANFNFSNFMTFVPYLKYSDERDSTLIPECEYDESSGELKSESVCYDPAYSPTTTTHNVVIENAGTVEEDYGSDVVIRIRYVGIISSKLECSDQEDECLTEEFQNEAQVTVYGDETLTASARLVVLCSYLLTQNAGDVYLEVELEGGSDISCIFVDEDEATSAYANVDALVVLEPSGETGEGEGLPSSYAESTISFCDNEFQNNIVGNLSSYICEIIGSISELWKKSTVESATESRVSQATRNVLTNQEKSEETYSNWDQLEDTLTNQNNPDSHILTFDGTLNSASGGKLTLGKLEIPKGAWTVIVEDADLYLSGDLSYATVSTAAEYKDLPSIAFIVLRGDIYVEKKARELVGVYYTDQKFDGDKRSPINEQLTIDGSLYGNVQALLDNAKYVAPPTISGGGLVIRYDSRILLNTPPALSEYVDVSSEKAVN